MGLPISLSDASGLPYYRQIVDQIGDLIRSGELPEGSRLPSVRDLAADLVVSTITVRKAFEDLERAGLAVPRQGQGTFVADNVSSAMRARCADEAREALGAAIARGRRLGLSSVEIQVLVTQLLGECDD